MYDPFLDSPLWGVKAIAEALNVRTASGEIDERRTYYILEKRYVDASKAGRTWTSTRRRLLAPHLAHITTAA